MKKTHFCADHTSQEKQCMHFSNIWEPLQTKRKQAIQRSRENKNPSKARKPKKPVKEMQPRRSKINYIKNKTATRNLKLLTKANQRKPSSQRAKKQRKQRKQRKHRTAINNESTYESKKRLIYIYIYI